jgi:hypothetical protein
MDLLQETLRYLRADEQDEDTRRLAVKAVAWVQERARPLQCLREGKYTATPDGFSVFGEDFASRAAQRHFEGSVRMAFLAVTLGLAYEQESQRLARADMAMALAVDAAGSAMVEAVAENACAKLEKEAACRGLHTTPRFSAGYADWDLADQGRILALLQAQKKCGIVVTAGGMMVPQKSVTAAIGLTPNKRDCKKGCNSCLLTGCVYRRSGT